MRHLIVIYLTFMMGLNVACSRGWWISVRMICILNRR